MSLTASHGSDAVAHHAANVAAVAFPVGAWIFNLPGFLQFILVVAGLGWYAVLFYDRFFKSNATVITKTVQTTTVIEPPKGASAPKE